MTQPLWLSSTLWATKIWQHLRLRSGERLRNGSRLPFPLLPALIFPQKTGCVDIKADENGKKVMKLKVEEKPQRGVIWKLPVKGREDLQIVCSRAKDATIAVPEIGFATGTEEKTNIDTIYNHIGQAIFKLEYLATESSEPQHREQITKVTEELRKCLDCDREWTFVLRDPSGMSEIKKENVNVNYF